jgi:hypothetical protein
VKVKDLAERLASCDPQALVVLVDTDGLPVRAGKVTEGFYSADYDEFALDDVNKDDPDFRPGGIFGDWVGVKAVAIGMK